MFCYQYRDSQRNRCILKGEWKRKLGTAQAMDLLLFVRGVLSLLRCFAQGRLSGLRRSEYLVTDALVLHYYECKFDDESILEAGEAKSPCVMD